jgi:hypothetical protein
MVTGNSKIAWHIHVPSFWLIGAIMITHSPATLLAEKERFADAASSDCKALFRT